MTRQKLKKHIIASFEASSESISLSPRLTAIKQACAGIHQEEIMPEAYVVAPRKFYQNATIQWAAALATIMVLVMLCVHLGSMVIRRNQSGATVPVVGEGVTDVIIDVNPSIEIMLDQDQLVVSCVALNDDANQILLGLNLVGTKSTIAYTTIIGALYMNGYLQGDTDALLFSLDSEDPYAVENTQKELAKIVKDSSLSVSIMIQTMDKDALISVATEYQISSGKLELIERIIDLSVEYTEADIEMLSKKTIRFLTDLYKSLVKDSPETPSEEAGNEPTASIEPIETTVPETTSVEETTIVEEETTSASIEATITTEIVSGVDEVVSEVITEAGEIVSSALDAGDQIADNAMSAADQIASEAIESAGQIASDVLGEGEAGEEVSEALGDAGQAVTEAFSEAAGAIDEAISEAGSAVNDALGEAGEEVSEALDEIWKYFIIAH